MSRSLLGPQAAPDSLGSQPESRKGGRGLGGGWGAAGAASLGPGLRETWRPRASGGREACAVPTVVPSTGGPGALLPTWLLGALRRPPAAARALRGRGAKGSSQKAGWGGWGHPEPGGGPGARSTASSGDASLASGQQGSGRRSRVTRRSEGHLLPVVRRRRGSPVQQPAGEGTGVWPHRSPGHSALGEGMRMVGGTATCSRSLWGQPRGHQRANIRHVRTSVPEKPENTGSSWVDGDKCTF